MRTPYKIMPPNGSPIARILSIAAIERAAGVAVVAPSGSGGTLTISAPSTGTASTALSITGTVSPSGDAVQVALGSSATTAPTSGFSAATVSSGTFSASLTPSASGTFYAWAKDASAGTTAVSSAITVAAAASETLAVSTITAPAASTTFTVSGTYTGGPPTALDYSTDGGTTWVAAASPTIGSGAFSFSISGGLAAGTYTVEVRDHTNTSVTATSNSFTIAAAVANATIASQSGASTLSIFSGNFVPSSLVSAGSGNGNTYSVTVGASPALATTDTAAMYWTNTAPTTEPTSAQAGSTSIIQTGAFIANYAPAPPSAGTWYLSCWIKDSTAAAVGNFVSSAVTAT